MAHAISEVLQFEVDSMSQTTTQKRGDTQMFTQNPNMQSFANLTIFQSAVVPFAL